MKNKIYDLINTILCNNFEITAPIFIGLFVLLSTTAIYTLFIGWCYGVMYLDKLLNN